MVLKNESLVSVIIPTHNRAKMLKRAIISVLNQDYTNFEIIVIADLCNDNTSDIVKSFKDKRIIYLSLEKNVGGAQARNIGLEMANGEYIAFLDDDDEWLKDKTSEQIKVFENDSQISIVSCNYFIYNGGADILKNNSLRCFTKNDLLYQNYGGSFSFCMTKNEFVKKLKINPQLKACQDWDLWLKILSKTGSKGHIINRPLVRYYDNHTDKLTNNHTNAINSYILFLRDLWPSMNTYQKDYHLYKLIKWKRKRSAVRISYFYNIRLFTKALKHYKLSGYNQSVYNYLLLIPQLLGLNKIFSK